MAGIPKVVDPQHWIVSLNHIQTSVDLKQYLGEKLNAGVLNLALSSSPPIWYPPALLPCQQLLGIVRGLKYVHEQVVIHGNPQTVRPFTPVCHMSSCLPFTLVSIRYVLNMQWPDYPYPVTPPYYTPLINSTLRLLCDDWTRRGRSASIYRTRCEPHQDTRSRSPDTR